MQGRIANWLSLRRTLLSLRDGVRRGDYRPTDRTARFSKDCRKWTFATGGECFSFSHLHNADGESLPVSAFDIRSKARQWRVGFFVEVLILGRLEAF